jgi:hypothetical protein
VFFVLWKKQKIMYVCLYYLSTKEVVLPSINGLINYIYDEILTQGWMNKWVFIKPGMTLYHWSLVHNSTILLLTIGNTNMMDTQKLLGGMMRMP